MLYKFFDNMNVRKEVTFVFSLGYTLTHTSLDPGVPFWCSLGLGAVNTDGLSVQLFPVHLHGFIQIFRGHVHISKPATPDVHVSWVVGKVMYIWL